MTQSSKHRTAWTVSLTSSSSKMLKKLPEKIVDLLYCLIGDIEDSGPIQKDWANFSPLKKDRRIPENSYHCHLKKGKPTYVSCWRIVSKESKKIEIFYVGTHENAPY